MIGEEAELLDQLAEAQAASKDAADELADLQSRTKQAQVDLVNAQLALQDAEADLGRRLAAREQAEARVAVARDCLRRQIVASYVAGGEDDGLLEAFLGAEDGDQVGQALAYGRAVSGTTETLVVELDEARAAEARAAKLARQARQGARLARRHRRCRHLPQHRGAAAAAARAGPEREGAGRGPSPAGGAGPQGGGRGPHQLDEHGLRRGGHDPRRPPARPARLVPRRGGTDLDAGARGQIGSPYGMRHHPILASTGCTPASTSAAAPAPRSAAAAGVVVVAEERGGYGNTVVIDHGGSLGTLYGHNSKLLVRAGDTVEYGQVIALMGSTGLSTGPHSHFETRVKGCRSTPERDLGLRRGRGLRRGARGVRRQLTVVAAPVQRQLEQVDHRGDRRRRAGLDGLDRAEHLGALAAALQGDHQRRGRLALELAEHLGDRHRAVEVGDLAHVVGGLEQPAEGLVGGSEHEQRVAVEALDPGCAGVARPRPGRWGGAGGARRPAGARRRPAGAARSTRYASVMEAARADEPRPARSGWWVRMSRR
ncbi:MAG: peptidoglycan DD-metalloendopeptidase family protein [Acidimicrobiales bacterium]